MSQVAHAKRASPRAGSRIALGYATRVGKGLWQAICLVYEAIGRMVAGYDRRPSAALNSQAYLKSKLFQRAP